MTKAVLRTKSGCVQWRSRDVNAHTFRSVSRTMRVRSGSRTLSDWLHFGSAA